MDEIVEVVLEQSRSFATGGPSQLHLKSLVNDANIVFWKWVSDTTIECQCPRKSLSATPPSVGAQIIDYRVTPDEKWLVLVAFSSPCEPAGNGQTIRLTIPPTSPGQYGEAAKIAANTLRGIMRTVQVIEAFETAPAPPGGLSPILQYFGILLEKGELNHLKSLELARAVLQHRWKQLPEKWLKENKVLSPTPLVLGISEKMLIYGIYEDGVPKCVVIINYIPAARTTNAVISISGGTIPANIKVKRLAESGVQKGGYTVAGQIFGGNFESDGRPMGEEVIETVVCDTRAQTWTVMVKAPSVALVFLVDDAEITNDGAASMTFGTIAHTKSHNTCTDCPLEVLATSNGNSFDAHELAGSSKAHSAAMRTVQAPMVLAGVAIGAVCGGSASFHINSVWSRLAKAQLDGLRVKDSIDSYIKAEDASNFMEVIEISTHAGKQDDLVRFLQMACKSLREPKIDTELAYAYAKTDRLHDMEDFLGMTNVADILEVGEKCFNDELYQAAKLLFASISNWARLATTLIYLGENQAAVDSARKAGNTQVWKQVHAACIEKSEFTLEEICGLNIIVHAEELSALVQLYERRGHFEEVIALSKAGLGLERAHMDIFTEMAILLSKYQPGKLMEHLKVYVSRINIPKVCRPVVLAFTASLSASTEVVEELLSYFADIGNKECFSALLRPVALGRCGGAFMAAWSERLLHALQGSSPVISRQQAGPAREGGQRAVEERQKKDVQKEQAEAPIINPG
ncbi:armadillo-type protein [Mycena crocata]|nr:armadillo-type protein [Mycena crocata]